MRKQPLLLAFVLIIFVGAVIFLITNPPSLGLDLRGGSVLTLQALPNPEQNIRQISPKILEDVRAVVERRLNGLGVSEIVVQTGGEDRIIVQLPGVNNSQQAEKVIGSTAQLEFRPQKQGTEAEWEVRITEQSTLSQLQLPPTADDKQKADLEQQIAANKKAIRDLFEPIGLTGKFLTDAVPSATSAGQAWQVNIRFNDEGGKLFAKATQAVAGTGRALGIFLDEDLVTSPRVDAEYQDTGISGGIASISGNFTLESATNLAIQLRSGALPVPLKVIENRTVGATLGADSIRESILASAGGAFLVLVFMVLYYRLPGVIASVALVVYCTLTIAAYKFLGVVLTLPGIAGFILSIGTAVDANVLIFERLKEELQTGKTLYRSVESGFNRAWSSILDGNITTLISCAALFWLGGGIVKGFAVTLSVGIAISMFTALTLSRAILLVVINIPQCRSPWQYGVATIGKPKPNGEQVLG